MYYFACSKCGSENIFRLPKDGTVWIKCKDCGCKGDLQESTFTRIEQQSQDLDPNYAKIVDKHFWDLV